MSPLAVITYKWSPSDVSMSQQTAFMRRRQDGHSTMRFLLTAEAMPTIQPDVATREAPLFGQPPPANMVERARACRIRSGRTAANVVGTGNTIIQWISKGWLCPRNTFELRSAYSTERPNRVSSAGRWKTVSATCSCETREVASPCLPSGMPPKPSNQLKYVSERCSRILGGLSWA